MIYFLAVEAGGDFIAVRTWTERTIMEVVMRYREQKVILLFENGTVWDGFLKHEHNETPWRNEISDDKTLTKEWEKDKYDTLLAKFGLQNAPVTVEEALGGR